MDTFTVELNQHYIELVGDSFTERDGEIANPLVSDFIDNIHEEVFQTSVLNEFDAGWRDIVGVEFEEESLDSFTSVCSDMYLSDELSLKEFRYLVQPIQVKTVEEYWEEHIEALKDSSFRYRKIQADNLSPLIEACEGFFDVGELIEILLRGVIDNIHPLGGAHNRPKSIVKLLHERIINNEDTIDMENEYFYQGPRHLGIIPTDESKRLCKCVCEYEQGYLFPFFIADSDPVSCNIQDVTEDLMDSDKGIH